MLTTRPRLKMFGLWGFLGGSVVKNLPASAGDTGSILIWRDLTCGGATKSVAIEPARPARGHRGEQPDAR